MSDGLAQGLGVDSASEGIYAAAKDGDLEQGELAGQPTLPHASGNGENGQNGQTGLVVAVLERSGVTSALNSASTAVGNAVGGAKAALAAKWEADKNFRVSCMAVGAVLLVLVFIFHLLANLKRLVAMLGMVAILGGCYAASVERDAVSWPRTVSSLMLQLIMGVLIAYTSVYYLFLWLGEQVKVALSYANEGGDFVFASYDQYGKQAALAGLDIAYANISSTEGVGQEKVATVVGVVADVVSRPMGGNFAIGVLPSIIFFSAFVEVMNHIGVLPWLMRVFAALFCFFTGCTIPEGVSAAANVFVGMTNAPLLIKPFMQVATPSHLVSIMGAGFGTAGAAMLPVYISMGAPPVHLLAAAWMGAPASLTCAKLLHPDSKLPGASGSGSEFTIESVRPEKCQNSTYCAECLLLWLPCPCRVSNRCIARRLPLRLRCPVGALVAQCSRRSLAVSTTARPSQSVSLPTSLRSLASSPLRTAWLAGFRPC